MTKRMSTASFRARTGRLTSHWWGRVATQGTVNILLTTVIAWSGCNQARLAQTIADATLTQARLAEESENRLTQATVNITYLRHSRVVNAATGEWLPIGEATPTDIDVGMHNFGGYRATNASWFDITIVAWHLEVGIPEDDDSTWISPIVHPIYDANGEQLTDSLPQRLRRGESIEVVFREEQLLSLQQTEKSWIRIAFQDAMGRNHRGQWIEWTGRGIKAHPNPGPGLMTPEEKRGERGRGT